MNHKEEFYSDVEYWAKGHDPVSTNLWEARKKLIRDNDPNDQQLIAQINGALRMRFNSLRVVKSDKQEGK